MISRLYRRSARASSMDSEVLALLSLRARPEPHSLCARSEPSWLSSCSEPDSLRVCCDPEGASSASASVS